MLGAGSEGVAEKHFLKPRKSVLGNPDPSGRYVTSLIYISVNR
jgi:hypothetical protein